MATKKTSIFYVIADSSLTGAPRHLLSLVEHLPKRDFSISVILPQGPLAAELKKHKVSVFTVPMRARSDTTAVNSVRKLLRKYDPDIMHAQGQRAGLIGRLAARGLPIKVVYTEHTRTPQFRLGNPVLEWAHIRAMRVLDKTTDISIAVSQAVADFLIRLKITKPDKVRVIYNGINPKPHPDIDAATLKLISQHNLKKRDFIIGTVGSLNIQKDTITLVTAVAKILRKRPEAKLVLVGSGPLRPRLDRLVKKLGITEQVIFAGMLTDVSGILQVMSMFVLPSKSEAFGISILEAMRAGVPVIATRVGGIPEVITNNKSGLLVEPGDPKQLASTIMRLMNDTQLQRKLVAGGREVVSKFSATRMASETAKLYKAILGRQS